MKRKHEKMREKKDEMERRKDGKLDAGKRNQKRRGTK